MKKTYKVKKIRKILLTIVWVCMMTLIFWFSSRVATVSQQESHRVGSMICGVMVKDYRKLSESQKLIYVEQIDHVVRKTAHFTEYAIFGMLTLGVYISWIKRKKIVLPLLWCALYAASDEFHQLFVSGRSAMWQDAVLDSAGALTGIVLLYVAIKIGESITQRVECIDTDS